MFFIGARAHRAARKNVAAPRPRVKADRRSGRDRPLLI